MKTTHCGAGWIAALFGTALLTVGGCETPTTQSESSESLRVVEGTARLSSGDGVSGLVVTLTQEGSETGRTTTTEATGRFAFEAVEPGQWILGAIAPEGYAVASEFLPMALDLNAEDATGLEVGVSYNLTVEATLPEDSVSAPGEYRGVEGALVQVLDANEELVLEGTTDTIGVFAAPLELGFYTIRIDGPDGVELVDRDEGAVDIAVEAVGIQYWVDFPFRKI